MAEMSDSAERITVRRSDSAPPVELEIDRAHEVIRVLDASNGVALGSLPWTGTVGVDPHGKLRVGSNTFKVEDTSGATRWVLRVVKARDDVRALATTT